MFLNLFTISFLIYVCTDAFAGILKHHENISMGSENTVRLSVRSKYDENGNWTTHFISLGDNNLAKNGWILNINQTLFTHGETVNIGEHLEKGSTESTIPEENESCACAESLKEEIEKLKVQLQEAKTSIDQMKVEIKKSSLVDQLKNEDGDNLCEGKSIVPNKGIRFHEKAGRNVVVSNDGRTVFRKAPNEWRELVALTNRSLNDCELFEITLTRKREDFISSLDFGVAFESPTEIDLPHKVNSYDKRFLNFNGQEFQEKNAPNPSHYEVGDRFGVIKTKDGYVHFYYNGKHLGSAKRKVNDTEVIYGFVEVYSSALEVTLE